jgi:hypothetical protein
MTPSTHAWPPTFHRQGYTPVPSPWPISVLAGATLPSPFLSNLLPPRMLAWNFFCASITSLCIVEPKTNVLIIISLFVNYYITVVPHNFPKLCIWALRIWRRMGIHSTCLQLLLAITDYLHWNQVMSWFVLFKSINFVQHTQITIEISFHLMKQNQ